MQCFGTDTDMIHTASVKDNLAGFRVCSQLRQEGMLPAGLSHVLLKERYSRFFEKSTGTSELNVDLAY
jgi:hypothetical protein